MGKQSEFASRGALRVVLQLIGVGAVYYLLGRLGLSVAYLHPSASPIWPPTGFAIASVLLVGARAWPAILVAAFFVNFHQNGNFQVSALIATGNTLEALLAGLLIHRFAEGLDVFNRPQNVMKFALYGACLATVISPTVGVSALASRGLADWADFGRVWMTWWLGDVMGALIFTPPFVLLFSRQKLVWNAMLFAQAIGSFLLLGVTVWMAYGELLPAEARMYVRGYLIIPVIAWIAFQFRPVVVSLAMLIAAALVIRFTIAGPNISTPTPANIPRSLASEVSAQNVRLLTQQGFMGTLALTMLCLSAAVSGKRLALMKVQESENRFRSISDDSPVMIWEVDADCKTNFVNRAYVEHTGTPAVALCEEDAKIYEEDRLTTLAAFRKAFENHEPYSLDYRLIDRKGEYRWVHATGTPRFLADGTFVGFVGSEIDINERRLYEEHLIRESMLDPLCRLPNRVLFNDRLQHRFHLRTRTGFLKFAVLFIDLDQFKSINDSYGHAVGDEVILAVAGRLHDSVREGDTAARMSGDEFAVLVEQFETTKELEDVAQRLVAEVGQPIETSAGTVRVTISIGVAVSQPWHSTAAEVLGNADEAMYRAKAGGGNDFVIADSAPSIS